MEWILESATGIPANSVLSINIGDTKRQGPISKIGQSFQFASSLAEPLPMEVEILTPAAPLQTIDLIPAEKTLSLDFGGQMQVKLARQHAPEFQRPLPNVKSAIAASGGVTSEKLLTAQSAASYMDQHDLVRTFQDILHGLLIVKPEDPLAYLEEHVVRSRALQAQKSEASTMTAAAAPATNRKIVDRSKSRGLIVSRSKVDALLEILQRTRKNVPLIMPMLPKSLSDILSGAELANECQKQFQSLDQLGTGRLGPSDLVPVIVQLSSESETAINVEQCQRFIEVFDANEDGSIEAEEFLMLTQFVIIAAHLESPEGKQLMEKAQLEERSFKDFFELLEKDKGRINDVVPFLPDWFVVQLTSDSFFEDCENRFDALDVDGSAMLEPQELLPVVQSLSGLSAEFIDSAKCAQFITIFDTHQNGVIMRDEFVDFVQFLVVMNFLSTTVEGQEVARLSSHHSDKTTYDGHIATLKKDWKRLPEIFRALPVAFVDEVLSDDFSQQCGDEFRAIDTDFKQVLPQSAFVPLVSRLCAEHPIYIDSERYKIFFDAYDKQQSGVIRREELVEFARFVVVIAYLTCCSEWHDVSAKPGESRVEELLTYLKTHVSKLDTILPYLPRDVFEGLTSSDFARQCMEDFANLDATRSGSLEATQLVPLILQHVDGYRLELTRDRVMEFAGMFDNDAFTSSEYVQVIKFMVILAYFEGFEEQVGSQRTNAAPADAKPVEDLLAMLKQDRRSIHKVIPLLPSEVVAEISSEAFMAQCQENFHRLDLNKKGVLSAEDLIPVVVELSMAHPHAVTADHCKRFISIFDIDGDGTVQHGEFVDFARFLCVMSYLHSEDGRTQVADALKIMEDSQQIHELLTILRRDRRQMRKIMPFLPAVLQDEITSDQFTRKCLEKFVELDKDGNESLDPEELYPMILEMTNAHQLAVDIPQCKKFTAIFDDEQTGLISKTEFVNFARFVMVGSFLQTEEGQKARLNAVQRCRDEKQRNQSSGKKGSGAKEQSSSSLPSATDVVTAATADVGRLTVDVEFYQKKSLKLQEENDSLRTQIFQLESELRRVQAYVEEQEHRLRLAEVNRQTAVK